MSKLKYVLKGNFLPRVIVIQVMIIVNPIKALTGHSINFKTSLTRLKA